MLDCPKCRLVSPDGALACGCDYDFTSHQRGAQRRFRPFAPGKGGSPAVALLASLLLANPIEGVAWTGSDAPSDPRLPWMMVFGWGLWIIHLPAASPHDSLANLLVVMIAGYMDSAVLAFAPVVLVWTAVSRAREMRNG